MILITGGTGSLGNALIPVLLERGEEVAVLSRDEYKQALMREKYPTVKWYIGDVRDFERVKEVFRNEYIDSVVHAAALKRVDSSTNPEEIVKTNIEGTHNVLRASTYTNYPWLKLLLISSDKAVAPLNAYGVSKAMAEKLTLARGGMVLRYGNVLWSRGSVLEWWEKTGKIALSAPYMTRFWLTLQRAASLVVDVLESGKPGEVRVPTLWAAPIEVLAEAAGYPPPYTYTGLRPGGEKMHELLEEGGQTSYNTEWYEVEQLRKMIHEGRPR